MADVVYNPLLKRNIQYFGGDSGDVDAKIAALQSNKVTKFFSAADNLEVNEVAQYQGTNDVVNRLSRGFFYEKQNSIYNVPANSFYVNFGINGEDFVTPLFTIKKGVYYYVADTDISYGWFCTHLFDGVAYHYYRPCVVGNPIVSDDGDIAYITSVGGAYPNNYVKTDSAGHIWTAESVSQCSGILRKFVNQSGDVLFVALIDPYGVESGISFCAVFYNNLFYPIPPVAAYVAYRTTESINVNIIAFSQVNSQPQPPIADRNHSGLMNKSFFEYSTWSDNFGLVIQRFGRFCFLFCIPDRHTSSSSLIPDDYAPNDALVRQFRYPVSMLAILQDNRLRFIDVVSSYLYTPCFFTYIIE